MEGVEPMTIKTPPATDAFREGHERIWGKKDTVSEQFEAHLNRSLGESLWFNDLAPFVVPSIAGRVPTPWLIEHMHDFPREVFYDQSLSEVDLKTWLEDHRK